MLKKVLIFIFMLSPSALANSLYNVYSNAPHSITVKLEETLNFMKTQGITLRTLQATLEDAEIFLKIRLKAISHASSAFTSSDVYWQGLSGHEMLAKMAEDISHGGHYLIVQDRDGNPIGCAAVTKLDPKNEKQDFIAVLWSVFVDPMFGGNGLARMLVKRAIELAEAMPGIFKLQLTVTKDNPVQNLYKSLGFEAWGTEDFAIKVITDGFEKYFGETSMHLIFPHKMPQKNSH